MKFINTDTGLKLDVSDDLINYLFQTGEKLYPKEFGGILIGYYIDDFKTLKITNTILPKMFKSSKTSFERDTLGIEARLKQYYKEIPSKYYVGEWHTHPDASVTPSLLDLKAIQSIGGYSKVAIKNPVFLILGLSKSQKDLAFYLTFENNLYKYEQS